MRPDQIHNDDVAAFQAALARHGLELHEGVIRAGLAAVLPGNRKRQFQDLARTAAAAKNDILARTFVGLAGIYSASGE